MLPKPRYFLYRCKRMGDVAVESQNGLWKSSTAGDMQNKQLLILILIALTASLLLLLDLDRYLNLDFLRAQQLSIQAFRREYPWQAVAWYFLIYVAVAALSLPGAAVMTLAGGAIFGLLEGTILVSLASTAGAMFAFLLARYLLRDAVQHRFRKQLHEINQGMTKDGAYYLFSLRLVPLFPFFVVNLLMALTQIPAKTFFWVSQLGMLPATVVYVNAGTRLAQVDSLADIASPDLLAAFTLLGLFPLLGRKLLAAVQARRMLKDYPKPKTFDRNLVVIGAGAAGLVSAYVAAAVKAKVTLIEKHDMGGDCLNTGCVPSKTLLRSAKLAAQLRQAQKFGVKSDRLTIDFAAVMARVHEVIDRIAPHDSVERYRSLGVECLSGKATITSPYSVHVNGRTLSTRSIIIAAGARPAVPPIAGIEDIGYLTSDTVWRLRERPERLVVLGGGPIGCELAQGFARLGSKVTQVEVLPRLLPREDADVARLILDVFTEEGIDVRLGHRALSVAAGPDGKQLRVEHEGREHAIAFDQLLVAVGRRANTAAYGLERLGIALTESGTIKVNGYLQTNYPNIFACGDVAGPYQFTHTAAHQAWYAAVNALFGTFKKFKVDESAIPWATFTDPEVARVGLNEQEARQRGIPYECSVFELSALDRAICDGTATGFVKVLTVPGKDRILGATLVGERASDLITELVSAMRHRLGLKKILRTIHIYPTLAEATKYAAGEWRKAHAPEHLLSWLARFHSWRRR